MKSRNWESRPVKWRAQWNTEAFPQAKDDFTGQGKLKGARPQDYGPSPRRKGFGPAGGTTDH